MLSQRDPHTGIRIKTNEEAGSPFKALISKGLMILTYPDEPGPHD